VLIPAHIPYFAISGIFHLLSSFFNFFNNGTI
jgi:hypothetical protein